MLAATILQGGPSITITAPHSALSRIKISHENGAISVQCAPPRGKDACKRPIIVFHVPNLTLLHGSDKATITATDITADTLEVQANDSAHISLERVSLQRLVAHSEGQSTISATGTTKNQECTVNHESSYLALGLLTERSIVTITHAAQAEVCAAKTLDITLQDASTLRYRGAKPTSQNNALQRAINAGVLSIEEAPDHPETPRVGMQIATGQRKF